MPYFFALIGLLAAGNFYMLFQRTKKGRNVGKKAKEERIAAVKEHDNLVRRLDREQEEASREVELRNKTFELYEQVRNKAKESTDKKDEDL